MNVVYKQSVKDENPIKYKNFKALAFMCFGMSALMVLLGDFIPAAVILIVGLGALYFRKYFLVSFEYEISGGEVSINKIIANKDRKRVYSFNISDIIIMAPERSEKLKQLNVKPAKTLKLYPKTYLKGIYIVVVKSGEETYKVKIMPDGKFVELCGNQNRANVIKG